MRTVIEKLPDGHIIVTREAPRGVPGTSKDRRRAKKRDAVGGWRKIARTIFRQHAVTETVIKGTNITIAPNDAEITLTAAGNEQVSNNYARAAEALVAAINRQADAYQSAPPRRIRVLLEEY